MPARVARVKTTKPDQKIKLAVVNKNILTFPSDIVALKYAQALHGLDRAASSLMGSEHFPPQEMPRVGDHRLVSSHGKLAARRAFFLGVPALRDFGYSDVRDFGRLTLAALAKVAPETVSLGLTVHGINLGLDESECFESLVAGLLDSLRNRTFPRRLESISIIERDKRRATRFRRFLGNLLESTVIGLKDDGRLGVDLSPVARGRLRRAGGRAETKPFLFVAMPFRSDMRDFYDYGIVKAVQNAGLLCERADDAYFAGDILSRVMARIDKCSAVIADISTANPNVYLEVGYAWGRGKPTILLLRGNEKPKFNVQGYRCIRYRRIKELEDGLAGAISDLNLA